MARYLYNKNSNSTAHYLYQQASNELVAVNIAPNFEFNRRTPIILISHGRFMQALGGKKIVRLLISKGLLKKDADGLFPVVDRISIAACYITERVPEGSAAAALPPKPVTDIPPEKFIEDLYHSFSAVKIPVNSISVREKLVAVDVLGRKWSGEPINPNAPENKWQINWALVKESDKKIIFTQKSNGKIVSERISKTEKTPMRSRRLRTSYLGRFGIDYMIKLTSEQTRKLNGQLDEKTAISLVENLKKGAVLMAADSMVLIAGMSESRERYGIIINGSEPNMAALQQALWQTKNHDDYKSWLAKLELEGGTKELTSRIEKLFVDPQEAFRRLKQRYLHDEFDLFCLDLSDPSSAGIIERDMRRKKAVGSIYLGQIEELLDNTTRQNMQFDDELKVHQEKIKNTIDKINNTLIHLSGNRYHTPLYHCSRITNKSVQSTVGESKLEKKYTKKRYLIQMRAYHVDTATQLSHSISMPITLSDTFSTASRELFAATPLQADKCMPLLLAMTYDKNSKSYGINYLHNGVVQGKMLTTSNDEFAEMKRFLEQQHETLHQHYHVVNGRLYPHEGARNKFFSKIETLGMGVNAVFAIMAIQHWLQNGSTVPGNTQLANVLQLHTYLAMTQVAFNIHNDGVTLLQAALKQDNVGRFSRLFQFITVPMGLGLTFADVTLSAIELSKTENEDQRILATTQLSFSAMGLSLFVGSMAAGLLGSTLLVSGLFAVGITLAVVGYVIQTAMANTLNNLDNAKIIADYFSSMLTGWRQAGFTLNRGILVPCQGTVITQVDLRGASSIFVVFDTEGQLIKRKEARGESTRDYINLYQQRPVEKTVQTLVLPDNAAGIKTLILPTQPRAKITPVLSSGFNFSLQSGGDSKFLSMDFFARKDAEFPFILYRDPLSMLPYFSAPSELRFNYVYTEVDILLGNHHYYLIAAGIGQEQSKHPLMNLPVYSEHLYYKFHAPQRGTAVVVLVLNRAQANMTIDCVNDQVNWLIDASHLNDIEVICDQSASLPEGNIMKFICRTLTTKGQYTTEVITIIKVKNSEKTKITLNLPQGITKWKPQQTIFCRIHFSELPLNQGEQDIISEEEVQAAVQKYLAQQGRNNRYAINTLRLDNYICRNRHLDSTTYEIKKIDDCFYLLTQPALLYTANYNQTIFNRSIERHNVTLIFHNGASAWYRGDLSITFQQTDGPSDLAIYKNVFWMSNTKTKKLQHLYLPAIHLPTITRYTSSRVGHPPAATSEIVQTHVLTNGILFQQDYIYYLPQGDNKTSVSKQIQLIYMIDTSSVEGRLTLLEVRGLPIDIVTHLINSHKLEMLDRFMTKQASASSAGVRFSSVTPAHINIVKLSIPQTTTTVSIGNNRLIWPLPNSLDGVTGNISAKIDSQLLNNAQYFITLLSAVKGNSAEDNHYFWGVTEPDNHHQFYKLYRQKGYTLAKEIRLNNFGLASTDVLSVTGIHQGIALNIKSGQSYHLTLGLLEHEQLTLHSLGKAWRELHQNWLPTLKMYIHQLRNKQKTSILVKAIDIAPILTITDLIHSDGLTALPVWYDSICHNLFICKEKFSSVMQPDCLGIANDQQGAWILNKRANNVEIGYLPAININPSSTFFNHSYLLNTAETPALVLLSVDELLSGEIFTGASLAEQGHINVVTQSGIILDISKYDSNSLDVNTPDKFIAKLLGVNSLFSGAYYDAADHLQRIALKHALDVLSKKYLCPEIIAILLKRNQHGWYHPQSEGLFILPANESTAKYLGFSEREQSAYFTTHRPGFLLKMSSSGNYDFIDNQGATYQRLDDWLILKCNAVATSDHLNTVDIPYALNIDVISSLLITSGRQQNSNKKFTVDIELLNYAVIQIVHRGAGSLHCRIPQQDTTIGCTITRKGEDLLLFIVGQILIITDVFNPRKNAAYGRLQLIFANGGITASELANYYNDSNAIGEYVIPMPNLE